MDSRRRIAEVDIKDLYVAQGRTMAELARHFAVSSTTMSRRFRDLGIQARRRGPVPARTTFTAAIEWTPELAYAVGLIATDGNLSRKPGRVSIVSNDIDLLEMVRGHLNITAPITRHTGGYGHRCHHLIWSDRYFYDGLLGIGLIPAKSLTLGPLTVPDRYFADFLRGCIDGDGSIVTYLDRYNTFKHPTYVYTRLFVSIVSASPRFVEWLRASVRRLLNVTGSLMVGRSPGKRTVWRLRYAKRESLAVLRWIYYAPDVPCLRRKYDIAVSFLRPPEAPRRHRTGRPMVV